MAILEKVLDKERLIKHIAEGYVDETSHPDGKTKLYTLTDKARRESKFDQVTLTCNGLVVRGGEVIARPPRYILPMNTPGFPETYRDFLPNVGAEITELMDAELMVAYPGNDSGRVTLATRRTFVGNLCGWATTQYRLHEKKNKIEWPDDYTPVFICVNNHDKHRLARYRWDGLCLVALVHKVHGSELPWKDCADWANHNDMRVVELQDMTVPQAFIAHSGGRGLMLKWDVGDQSPAFRVKLTSAAYHNHATMLQRITPHHLWTMMRAGNPLVKQFTCDPQYPGKFRDWAKYWTTHIEQRVKAIDEQASDIFLNMPVQCQIPCTDRDDRKSVVSYYAGKVEKNVYLWPILFALLDDKPYEDMLWQEAEKLTEGAPHWQGGE